MTTRKKAAQESSRAAFKKTNSNSNRSRPASNAEALLSRLDGVKRTGPDRWSGRCPAHDDNSPSLSVRETEEGRLLVRCFAGCTFENIIAAAGVDVSAMFPPRPPRPEGYGPERRPFLPSDVFEVARIDVAVVFLIGCDLHKHKAISEQDYERLLRAYSRLERIAEAAYGR